MEGKLSSEDEIEWHTCCSNTEKTFVKYIVQVVLGFTVILFSMIQIMRNTGENNSIYFSLISGTFGIFTPQPSIASGTLRRRNSASLFMPTQPEPALVDPQLVHRAQDTSRH